MKRYNVNDMYKSSKSLNSALLCKSSFTATFLEPYKTNYANFDNIFNNTYKGFFYYDQECFDEEEETVAELTERFRQVVTDWFLVNMKRYNELFRVQVVNDSDYSILDNYDITETYNGTEGRQSSTIEGERTDLEDMRIGNQYKTQVNKVAAFNSSNENVHDTNQGEVGTRNDKSEFTKGQMTSTYASNGQDGHNMRKKGNIGVMTQSDVMSRHVDFWKLYNFYKFIFEEINEQFLLVN